MNKKTIFTFVMSALLVTGCGGGGGGSSGSSSSSSSGITTSTAPTAKFSTSSQTDADTLTKEIQSGTPALVQAASMQNMPGAISALPAGIGSLPAGVTYSTSCASFSSTGIGSGTVSYDTNMTGSTPTAGTYVNMTFSGCSFVVNTTTFTLNGSALLTYNSYTDASNFSVSISYSNYDMSIVDTTYSISESYGPLNGSFNMVASNGVYSFEIQLANGGATNLSNANVIYSGTDVTITSATYEYNSPSAGGIIRVVYNNWTYDSSTGYPVSGTITVTDASGDTVVIDDTSGTVTVTYNIIGSSPMTYTVTFP